MTKMKITERKEKENKNTSLSCKLTRHHTRFFGYGHVKEIRDGPIKATRTLAARVDEKHDIMRRIFPNENERRIAASCCLLCLFEREKHP